MAEETAPVATDQAPAVVATPGDTVGTAVEQTQEQTGQGAGPADETPVVELSEEQQKSWNTLPPDVRKQVNRIFTQKTQDFAKEREELSQVRQLAQALQANPDMTVEFLARGRGFEVKRVGTPNPTQQEKAVTDQHYTALEAQFGPEAAKAIMGAAEKIADSKAEARVKPLQEFHQRNEQERERADAASAVETLAKEFPDWETYKPQMTQLAQKLQPGPGMTKAEYARILYLSVNPNRTSAQQTKDVLKKLTEAGKSAEAPAQTVPNNRVAKTLPAEGNFEQRFKIAAEAAARGEILG